MAVGVTRARGSMGRFSTSSLMSTTPGSRNSTIATTPGPRMSTLPPGPRERYSIAPSDLEARAEQKREFVQEVIDNLERAIRNIHQPEEEQYLKRFVDPEDQCFRTLVCLAIVPKYADFVDLRCAALRAVQMILKIAAKQLLKEQGNRQMVNRDANIGKKAMRRLLSENSYAEAFRKLVAIARKTEQATLACDAMLVLAELGPEAFDPPKQETFDQDSCDTSLVVTLLELFDVLPDRATDLVEVALRAHAWGGAVRTELIEAAVKHEGGKYMGEVLLQTVNRSDPNRQLRAVKIFSGCFGLPDGSQFLYTNDKRVLVEILLRELPNHVGDAAEFVCFADCYQALITQCEAARSHQRHEAIQLFEDLGEDDRYSPVITKKCEEALAILKSCQLL